MNSVPLMPKHLIDYQQPHFLVHEVSLRFVLHPTQTRVYSRLVITRNPDVAFSAVLSLMGEDLILHAVSIDGVSLSATDYQLTSERLLLNIKQDSAVIEIETEINPQANSRLEGLYLSDGVFCTQCEAEGFRRITYFSDRPDVMASYTVRIEAPTDLAPVLLSNGNLLEQGLMDLDGWHYAQWQDPHPKPCYLFALVAGDLVCRQRPFVTAEGRNVSLEVYVKAHHGERCEHALVSLEKAMRWDEQRFGLCYDLDRYMIVAVDDFNMGAMENKGLNVFNARFVLADPQTATDIDYTNIDSVIAHEYFHNWTGNRVTCRNWFQLTLKEGLTVFRDQLYTEETLLGKVKRIEDVRTLRSVQFAEDASPLQHPIQPASYVEMNNFYTATVYEKGAEVVRIYQTLLGKDGFRNGMDLYFARHDGQAVTVHEFRAAMSDANGVDLSQMHAWYTQAGTPRLDMTQHWSEATGELVIQLKQSLPNAKDFQSLLVPISLAIFNTFGERQACALSVGKGKWGVSEGVLWFDCAQASFTFSGLTAEPKLSLLRDFSAPVILTSQRSLADWLWQAQYDDDLFNRWEGWQQAWLSIILSGVSQLRAGHNFSMPEQLLPVLRAMLADDRLDAGWLAEVLRLPSFDYCSQQLEVLWVDELLLAMNRLRSWLGTVLATDFLAIAQRYSGEASFTFSAQAIGHRALHHLLFAYLAQARNEVAFTWAIEQIRLAESMTHVQAALTLLVHNDAPQAKEGLALFFERWHDINLVLDKWFALQASSPLARAKQVDDLCNHQSFIWTNPNRVRSVLSSLGRLNPSAFHQVDGEGYRLLAQRVAEVDAINHQVASRVLQAFNTWRKLPEERRVLAKAALESLVHIDRLSRDVREVLMNLLANHDELSA